MTFNVVAPEGVTWEEAGENLIDQIQSFVREYTGELSEGIENNINLFKGILFTVDSGQGLPEKFKAFVENSEFKSHSLTISSKEQGFTVTVKAPVLNSLGCFLKYWDAKLKEEKFLNALGSNKENVLSLFEAASDGSEQRFMGTVYSMRQYIYAYKLDYFYNTAVTESADVEMERSPTVSVLNTDDVTYHLTVTLNKENVGYKKLLTYMVGGKVFEKIKDALAFNPVIVDDVRIMRNTPNKGELARNHFFLQVKDSNGKFRGYKGLESVIKLTDLTDKADFEDFWERQYATLAGG
jgi:hypothetical protein